MPASAHSSSKRPRSPSTSASHSPTFPPAASSSSSAVAAASHRPPAAHLFSCATCAKRKVRCDKKNPCTYCVTHGIECVPTEVDPSKPRKRRFPEAELLARIKRYEAMLTKMGVDVDDLDENDSIQRSRPAGLLGSGAVPLHVNDIKRESNHTEFFDPRLEKERIHEILRLHQPADGESASCQALCEGGPKGASVGFDKGFDAVFIQDGRELLRFDDHYPGQPLRHPQAWQVFKIWQYYKDRVHPLVKLIHLPTVQSLVMDVGCDSSKGTPQDHATLFCIYSLAASTLTMSEASALFEVQNPDAQIDALNKSAQTALFRANVWKSGEPSLFTALFAYIMAVSRFVDPRLLVLYLGLTDRLGRRNGLHISTDDLNGKSVLDREMRRRAWWEFHCFDSRSAEKAGVGLTELCPTVVPLPIYVNDSELHNTYSPGWTPEEAGSEVVFAAVRWESTRFIAMTSQSARTTSEKEGESAERLATKRIVQTANELEERLSKTILKPRSRPDVLFRMAQHFAAYTIARIRMLAFVQLPVRTQEDELEILRNGMIQLQNDRLWKSDSGCEKFGWMTMLNLPMPAYIHVLNLLKRHTSGPIVEACWEELGQSPSWLDRIVDFWAKYMGYERFNQDAIQQRMKVFRAFQLKAWEARSSALKPGTPAPKWIAALQREAALDQDVVTDPTHPGQSRRGRPPSSNSGRFTSALGEFGPISSSIASSSTGTMSGPNTPLDGSSFANTSSTSTHHDTPSEGISFSSSHTSPSLRTDGQSHMDPYYPGSSNTHRSTQNNNRYNLYNSQMKPTMPSFASPSPSNYQTQQQQQHQQAYPLASPTTAGTTSTSQSNASSSFQVPSASTPSNSTNATAPPPPMAFNSNSVNFLNDFSIIPATSDPNGMTELLQMIQGDLNIDWTQWLNSTGPM